MNERKRAMQADLLVQKKSYGFPAQCGLKENRKGRIQLSARVRAAGALHRHAVYLPQRFKPVERYQSYRHLYLFFLVNRFSSGSDLGLSSFSRYRSLYLSQPLLTPPCPELALALKTHFTLLFRCQPRPQRAIGGVLKQKEKGVGP
jgi:rRNA maturation protein Nop10